MAGSTGGSVSLKFNTEELVSLNLLQFLLRA